MSIDLPRIQRALDRLRRILRAHPEVRERTADYLAGDLPEREEQSEHDQEQGKTRRRDK